MFNQFVDYHARANVAERLTLKDEQKTNEDFAQKVLGQWVQSLKSGYVEWFVAEKNHSEQNTPNSLFEGKHGKVLLNDFSEIANNVLSGKIFRFGLENLIEAKKNQNAWSSVGFLTGVEVRASSVADPKERMPVDPGATPTGRQLSDSPVA